MNVITPAESLRQPLAHRQSPVDAYMRLIGRDPKALRVHQIK
ncbi:MAG TPA: hypothetical protein VGK54_11035 [Chloroflexota bacterium]|jgi:hypothetical protein